MLEFKNNEEYCMHMSAVTNAYYILQEASDMMCREMEILLAMSGKGIKGNIKMRHNMMMQKVKALKLMQETFLKDYTDAFNADWTKYDELRRCAAYICRIMLLISDRSYEAEMNTKKGRKTEEKIEKLIAKLPANNMIKQEFIDIFKCA